MFPIPSNERTRLAALRDLAIVGSRPEPHFDAICRLARSTFSVPIALISFIEEDRQWFKAKCGLDIDGTVRDVAFCNHTILSDDPLIVEDAAADPRFFDNPLVRGKPHIRFYAGMPLSLAPGVRIGSLCIIDRAPRTLTSEQVGQLRDMGEIIVAHLRLHAARQAQAAELDERRRLSAELERANHVLAERNAEILATHDARRVAEAAASFGHWRIDAADRTIAWSDGVAAVFGASMPDAGKLPLDQHLGFYHPDERAALRSRIERVIAGTDLEVHDGYQGHARAIRPDGEVRIVMVRGVPVRDANGAVTAIHGIVLDVTEQAHTQARLREVGEVLGSTLDSMDQGLVVLDADQRIRAFNRAAAELLDLPAYVLREGAALADIRNYHQSRGDFTEIPSAFRKRLEKVDLKHLPAVYDLPLPNGTTLEVRRSDRTEGGWIITFTDVTQQRLAERAIQESEHRYRLLAENTTDIIIWCDLTTRRRYVSPAVTAVLGYEPEDLTGTRPLDFVHPDEADAYRQVLDELTGGRVARTLTCQRYRHRDGRWIWLEILFNLTHDASTGRADGYVATLRDITQRKAMEDALRESDARYRSLAEAQLQEARARADFTIATSAAILAQLAEGVIVTDAAGRITQVNAAAAEIHGVARLDVEPDAYSDTYHLFTEDGRPYPPRDLPLARAVGGRTVRDARWRVRRPDGTEVVAIGNALPLLGQGGTQIGAVLTLRDDTARAAAECALRELNATLAQRVAERTREAEVARDLAEAASRAKSEFLAAMSHEIRTPLNGVIGYADLMLDEPALGPHTRKYAERIHSAGAALLTVVNDILDFSKVEAGQVEITPKPFSLEALIDNAVAIVRAAAERKGLALRAVLRPEALGVVVGDEDRLRQVLLNLLSNAIKFTPAGAVALLVDGRSGGDGLVRLRFAVEDTGIGIPEDKRHLLFQRFSQIDGRAQRAFGGTGLGLAICKGLIERMGGTIGVESAAGRGATFWFTVELPTGAKTRISGAVPEPVPQQTVGCRLLLADDVPLNQELARTILEKAGHTVDVVANGAEAVRAIQAERYDLVLMDVQMPVMDGLAATRLIRALDQPRASVPVIGLTANVLPEQIGEIRAAGMNDHLGKPFRREALLGAIERWTAAVSRSPGSQPNVDLATLGSLQELVGRKRANRLLTQLSEELTHWFGPSAKRDRDHVVQGTHAMVSAASLLGFNALAAMCRTVETACRSGESYEASLAVLRALTGEALAEIEGLKALRDEAPIVVINAPHDRFP